MSLTDRTKTGPLRIRDINGTESPAGNRYNLIRSTAAVRSATWRQTKYVYHPNKITLEISLTKDWDNLSTGNNWPKKEPSCTTPAHNLQNTKEKNTSSIAAGGRYMIENKMGEGAYCKVKLPDVMPSRLERFPDMDAYADNDGNVKVAITVLEAKNGPNYSKKCVHNELDNHCSLPLLENVTYFEPTPPHNPRPRHKLGPLNQPTVHYQPTPLNIPTPLHRSDSTAAIQHEMIEMVNLNSRTVYKGIQNDRSRDAASVRAHLSLGSTRISSPPARKEPARSARMKRPNSTTKITYMYMVDPSASPTERTQKVCNQRVKRYEHMTRFERDDEKDVADHCDIMKELPQIFGQQFNSPKLSKLLNTPRPSKPLKTHKPGNPSKSAQVRLKYRHRPNSLSIDNQNGYCVSECPHRPPIVIPS